MRVADKMAVSIHYTLTDDEGQIIDSSDGNEPLVYLHGYGNIISGLEKALTDKAVGEKLNVRIEAEDAYGPVYEDRVQVVSRAMFEGVDELEVGMQFHADVSSGPGIISIVSLDGDDVTIDGNHPLAGVALTFAVEIIAVRPASLEELTHGHIHSGSCHH